MERSSPIEELLQTTISSKCAEYIEHFHSDELIKEYLFSENPDLNLF